MCELQTIKCVYFACLATLLFVNRNFKYYGSKTTFYLFGK